MIQIHDTKDCCGCEACMQRCPKGCISMQSDSEGFLYPKINLAECIGCGLCEKVCPVINQGEIHASEKIFAAKHKNEQIRMTSSSGGIFTVLAEAIIDEGGVVFGAKFNKNWEVIHDFAEIKEDLLAFRGSKYVQSHIGNSFKITEYYLKQGRKVLFSGTPCQIAGLRLFLQKEYENLLTVDFICHGVPSPKVWQAYLDGIISQRGGKNLYSSHNTSGENIHINSIVFRDKQLGWRRYSLKLIMSASVAGQGENSILISEPLDKNVFLRGFMSNMFLRPSCHFCKCRESRSGSDITLGDCWGIEFESTDFNDDKGISLCMINTFKGEKYFMPENMDALSINIEFVRKYNHSFNISDKMPSCRSEFFKFIDKESNIIPLINRLATYPTRNLKTYLVKLTKLMGIYLIIKKKLK